VCRKEAEGGKNAYHRAEEVESREVLGDTVPSRPEIGIIPMVRVICPSDGWEKKGGRKKENKREWGFSV